MNRALLPVLLVLVVTACSRGSTVREEEWPSGKLREQWSVVRGSDGKELKDGSYQAWNEEGRLTEEGTYVQGQATGPWTSWYGSEPNQKRREGSYVDGVMDGIWHAWMDPSHAHAGHAHHAHAAGEHPPAQMQETYKLGVPDGLWISWHTDGSVADSANYVDGLLQGLVVSYHPNGQKALEVVYEKGEPVGRQTVWNEAGEVISVID